MKVLDLGLIDYAEALQLQDEAVSALVNERADVNERVFVCEHPAVITVGRALGSKEEVFGTAIPVFEISRGGRSTLHLPGQVVVYPILDLEKRGKDLHAYMRCLELGVIDTLADFRITAESIEQKTGVWVRPSAKTGSERKIASLGIGVKHWVSSHGVALNVACDLSLFRNLNPCGFGAGVMTAMHEEMPPEYLRTWAVTPADLVKQVKARLVENILSRLDGGFLQTEKLA